MDERLRKELLRSELKERNNGKKIIRCKYRPKYPDSAEREYVRLINAYMTIEKEVLIKYELQQGIEIDGETEEYAFDLNEFFAITNGKFNHESSVDKFLDAMTRQTKFPFSTEEL